MHRAARLVSPLVPPLASALVCALIGAIAAGPAAADASVGSAFELGLEVDSNVRRVEDTSFEEPMTAPMLRMAGRVDGGAAGMGGNYGVSASAHLRTAVGSQVTSENYAQFSVDGQWTRPVREGQVRLGARVGYRDAFPLAAEAEDRTFRSASADMVVVLYGGRARVTVSAGPRFFKYKPDDDEDEEVGASWRGGGAAARGDFSLWQGGEDDEDSLDLAVSATLEQRAYYADAYTNICESGAPISYRCFEKTERDRGDRWHRAGAVLSYSGAVVASGEAQITVLDSNSYGRSWTGGKLRGAVTLPLGKSYLTAAVTLQIESYADRLLVARDPDVAVFDLLEDDNRSSAELRVGLPLSDGFLLEGRVAGWKDFSDDLEYRRLLGAIGLVWTP